MESTRSRNLELVVGATDPESDLRSAREEPNALIEGQPTVDDGHFSVASHVQNVNRLEHRLRKTNTAREVDRAVKVAFATDIFKTKTVVEEVDHHVRLSEVKTIVGQVLIKSGKKEIFK